MTGHIGALRRVFLGLLGALMLGATPALAEGEATAPGGDAELAAAIEHARATMDDFDTAFAQHPEALGFLKVAIPYEGGAEHIWMQVMNFGPKTVTGKLSNSGRHVSQRAGEIYSAPYAMLSDWMVMHPPFESGKIYGSFTNRLLLARNPDAFPPGFAERLQPLPGG